ncbi:MAG: CHAT domain-containing protein [Bryobacteraceae bacterium]
MNGLIDGSLPEGEANRFLEHIQGCDACQRLWKKYQQVERQLGGLRVERTSRPGEDCPPDEMWAMAATAQTGEATSAALLDHAAGCDRCGLLLRRAVDAFMADPTAEEQQTLVALASAKPEWKRDMAAQLTRRPSHARAWMAAAAAAVFLVAGFWWTQRPRDPQQLLARAFEERRPFELRFPGADRTPVRLERGEGNRPASLLEVELMVANSPQSRQDDPAWLQIKARAELLQWKYEDAFANLRRAMEIQPDSPQFLSDLAMAHFERAERANRPEDYSAMVELLSKALAARPNEATWLFNRAIAYERLFLYEQAISDWERYLQVDASSKWSAEARERLEGLRKRKEQHDRGSRVRSFDSGEVAAQVPSRSEAVLETAWTEWLPASVTPAAATQIAAALRSLAAAMSERHADQWLRDVLALPRNPSTAQAVARLSAAIRMNLASTPSEAEAEAETARQMAAGAVSLEARARLEQIYALRRMVQAKRCLDLTPELRRLLDGRSYTWIETQLDIEEANCHQMAGDFEAARALIERAASRAKERQLPFLELRALGIAAFISTESGNTPAAWTRTVEGLRVYWEGGYPPVRGFQFYAEMTALAERREWWRAALAARQQAVRLISLTPNTAVEAMQRFGLATAATAAGEAQLAASEFVRAEQLFASLKDTPANRAFRAYAELGLAGVELDRGDVSSARGRLSRLEPQVRAISNQLVRLRYLRTSGALQLRDGRGNEAESALDEARSIAAASRAALSGDRDRERWSADNDAVYRLLTELHLRSRNDPEAAWRIWRSYRDLDQSGKDASLPSPLLAYAVFRDGLSIWLLREGVNTQQWVTIPRARLDSLIDRYTRLCADPQSSTAVIARDGRQLFELLIAPIAGQLRDGESVLVEPDGEIGSVPIETLTGAGARPLADRLRFVTFDRGRPAARPPAPAPEFSLVVGAPEIGGDLAEQFPPLRSAMEEAEAVAALLPNARLLTGPDARIETVLRLLPGATFFHFAGHAVSEGPSALLLASNEGAARFSANSVASLDLRHCRLVVLSACSTGVGERRGPWNPDGLASGFRRAGAAHVVASRWDVDSQVSAQLMKRLYAGMARGQSPAEALYQAQAAIRSEPATSHPYYWAAFQQVGAD